MTWKLRIRAVAGGLLLSGALLPMTAAAQSTAPKRITPFVLVEKKADGGRAIPANTYTRLEIASSPSTGGTINYAKRDLLFRIGIGKKYTFGSILRAEAGFFKDTIPLVSREYESSTRVGESFTRTIGLDTLEFPYFLSGVDATTRVGRFSVTADMAETTSSQVSSLALSFVRNALKAVAPTSGLLTTFTKESSETIADTIDQQANMLFGTTVGEEIAFDLPLDQAISYEITVFGPKVELDELMANGAEPIGKWTVSFAAPRPSVFSSQTCTVTTGVCDWQAAYNDAIASPASILAFKLVDRIDDLGTVRAFLLHQDWWTSDMLALEAVAATTSAAHAQFCRKIRGAVAELGLNDIDGRVVATAVARSGLVTGKVKAGLEAQADCKYG